jgi:hypothetical protein
VEPWPGQPASKTGTKPRQALNIRRGTSWLRSARDRSLDDFLCFFERRRTIAQRRRWASAMRALPSAVRGPVESPPWKRQRLRAPQRGRSLGLSGEPSPAKPIARIAKHKAIAEPGRCLVIPITTPRRFSSALVAAPSPTAPGSCRASICASAGAERFVSETEATKVCSMSEQIGESAKLHQDTTNAPNTPHPI